MRKATGLAIYSTRQKLPIKIEAQKTFTSQKAQKSPLWVGQRPTEGKIAWTYHALAIITTS